MDFLGPDTTFQDYGIEFAKKAGTEICTFATEELNDRVRHWIDPEEPPVQKRNSPLIVPFIFLIKVTFLMRDLAVFVANTVYYVLLLPLDVSLVLLHFLSTRIAGNPVEQSNIMPVHLSRDMLYSGVPISTGRGCRQLQLPQTLVTIDTQGGSRVVKDNSRSRVRFPTSGVINTLSRQLRRIPLVSRFFPQLVEVKQSKPVDFHTRMGSLNDALNSQLSHRAVPVSVQKSNYSSL